MFKFLWFLLALGGSTHLSLAQKQPYVTALGEISLENIKNHVFVMASDSLDGRRTGALGQKKAANYIAKCFAEGGLIPAFKDSKAASPFFQTFGKHSLQLEKASLSIQNQSLAEEKDFAVLRLGTPPQELKTKLWDQQATLETAFQGLEKGSTPVLRPSATVLDESSYETYLQAVMATAHQTGCTSAVVVPATVTIYKEIASKIGLNKRIQNLWNNKFALVLLSPKTAGKTVKNGALLTMNLTMREKEGYFTENVGAWLPGKDSSQTIVLTAHYDHLGRDASGRIFYGADDNGSGVAALLEIARVMGTAYKNGYKWHKNILFLAVSAEEIGLVGSQYYTDVDPRFALKGTCLNLNTDMIGREFSPKDSDYDYVSTVGSDWLSSELHNSLLEINAQADKLKIDLTYNDVNHPEDFFFRSDQYNFAKYRIPAIFFTSPDHVDYHKVTDTADKISMERIQKISRLMMALTWQAALKTNGFKIDRNKY